MRRVVERGYPVRAVMMPIIPLDGWEDAYRAFTERLLKTVPVRRLTLGGICIYRGARELMERKMGRENVVSAHIEGRTTGDGRARYSPGLRSAVYSLVMPCRCRRAQTTAVAAASANPRAWRPAFPPLQAICALLYLPTSNSWSLITTIQSRFLACISSFAFRRTCSPGFPFLTW